VHRNLNFVNPATRVRRAGQDCLDAMVRIGGWEQGWVAVFWADQTRRWEQPCIWVMAMCAYRAVCSGHSSCLPGLGAGQRSWLYRHQLFAHLQLQVAHPTTELLGLIAELPLCMQLAD